MFKYNEQCCEKFRRSINQSVLHNYFDGGTKLFSDLYLAKLLNISSKVILSV